MNRNIDNELLEILACPVCNGDIEASNSQLKCNKCNALYQVKEGIPVMLPPHLEEEQKMAIKIWGKEYEQLLFDIKQTLQVAVPDQYALSDYNLVRRFTRRSDKRFIEVGCGRARLSLLLAKQGLSIVGLDLSLAATILAKSMFDAQGLHGHFVCGDILCPPFKSGSFNLAFAGGSIEHFDNTQQGVKAIANLLSQDGTFIATVPFASLSTLLQGLFTGNIPDIPILRSLFKFLHLELLGKRRCLYGYEKSFTQAGLCKYFRQAELSDLEVGPYTTNYTLKFFRNRLLRQLIQIMIQLRPFWPMVYIKGKRVRAVHC
jgi:uncharacterized protein YbaR (Trm112 family)/ubiquinone/menaquinone biosynthesis C-methylase UbiE